jgi:adenine-specific DNA-methyltransferase
LFEDVVPSAPWTSYGEIFTRRWVVDTLLDLTGYTVGEDLAVKVLLEPSAGSGAFLLPAVERLIDSAQAHGQSLDSLAHCVRAWELQPQNIDTLRSRLVDLLISRGADGDTAASLATAWLHLGDFLLSDDYTEADVVVGNPPYIRIEDLPPHVSADYRYRWPTMGGRADIYVGFFERSLSLLKPGGRVGFICADRWMRNQYGQGLRQLVSRKFAVDAVWVMHDVDAFEERVSAYPAITILRAGPQGAVVAAEGTERFGPESAKQLSRWSARGKGEEFAAPGVTAYRLPHWFPGEESWPAGTPRQLRLIEHLNDRFLPLHDPQTNTKVSIGVATGADKVFVTGDAQLVEPDRLLPLAMVRDIQSGEFKWSGNYLVNPWQPDGTLIKLDDYPRMKAYLETTGRSIKDRHVAKKAPRSWYRTIDKVHHQLTAQPKLLLQDMRTEIHPVLESGGYYPHHNLYYVTSTSWDMEVLGGLLLSRIAQAFIEAYSVRMRGGTLRFQSQYLKRIRVPKQSEIADEVNERLREAFRARDVDAATSAAAEAYGLNGEDWA